MKYILILIMQFGIIGSVYSQQIKKKESLQSLYLEVFFGTKLIGNATGFIIKSKTQYYLITNWHVVTGKNPDTQNWLPGITTSPNKITIKHLGNPMLGQFAVKTETLMYGFDTLYKQFKIENKLVDAVAIPLKDTTDISIFPVNYSNTYESINLSPTENVFVVGFPSGFSLSGLPVWKSGTIASEPEINPEVKPIIYIDANGIGGMSGSPVYFISNNYITKEGTNMHTGSNPDTFFLGVFAGGQPNIAISYLWKSTYLKSFFDSLP